MNNRRDANTPQELIYFQFAENNPDNEFLIIKTAAVVRDILVNRDSLSVSCNVQTDDNPGYLNQIKSRRSELVVPENAIIYVLSDNDEDCEEDAGSGSAFFVELSARDIADSIGLISPGFSSSIASPVYEVFTGVVNLESGKDIAPDECDLRMMQVVMDKESGTLIFRDRIISPDISGIGVSDPCFTYMDSLNIEDMGTKAYRCDLDCEHCTCNVSNPNGKYAKFLSE